MKRWIDDRGIGWIKRDRGADLYVHHSAIQDMIGHRSLVEGEEVTFEIAQGMRGPEAANVRRVQVKPLETVYPDGG